MLTLNIFHTFFAVSIADFEKVIVCWVGWKSCYINVVFCRVPQFIPHYLVGLYYTGPKLTPVPSTPAFIGFIFQMFMVKLS